MNLIELNLDNLALTFPIGHAFSAEAGRKPFDEKIFGAMWDTLLSNQLGKIYALVEWNEETGYFVAAALLGATFLPDPFSGELTAAEHFWYVLPEHRKSGIGLQLLEKFEADAKELGCTQVVMVHFMHMGQGLAKLYEARGYKALEQTFKKEI
jgi:GNAT superfamily N-acetyltransferase